MKLLRSLLLLLFVLALSGCNSQQGYAKITKNEQQELIMCARTAIKALPGTKLTDKEKEVILKENPEILISYTGNKVGHYSLSWNMLQKTVTYTGNGNITAPEENPSTINVISVDANQ